MKKNKGFTLIEVLAVLVILSLLITFSVVSVNKIKKKQEVANRINVIRSILTAARAYEADYPGEFLNNAGSIIGITVDDLLEKNYVDFDTSKYEDLIKVKISGAYQLKKIYYHTDDLKKEFYTDIVNKNYIGNDKNELIIVTDCGFETEQDTNKNGKKLCLYNSCINGKCNGWDINGKAINSNPSNTVVNING